MPTDRTSISLATETSAEGSSVVALPESPRQVRETILLVEDEQMVRTLARHILELIGYNVLEAASGSEALEVCKDYNGSIDLLLTDVVMPKMSGPQLSEAVVKLCPEIAIIFMSGYTDNVITLQGASPVVPFLQKPFSPDALALKIRETLDAAAQARSCDSKTASQDSSLAPQVDS